MKVQEEEEVIEKVAPPTRVFLTLAGIAIAEWVTAFLIIAYRMRAQCKKKAAEKAINRQSSMKKEKPEELEVPDEPLIEDLQEGEESNIDQEMM